VHGTGPSVLLVGDSHAAMLIPTFIAIAQREHLTLSVSARGLCPWQRNLYAPAGKLEELAATGIKGISAEGCKELRDDLYDRVIPELHPDIVVAMDYDFAYRNPRAETVQSLPQLARDGRKVILVEDTPNATIDTRDCLSKAKVLEDCRFVANRFPTPLERLYRQLARAQSRVYAADFDRLVCPFLPICDPVVDGQIVTFDGSHLTVAFSKLIAPQVDAYLQQTVIKPPGA
jgi:hypothetical protein